MGGAIKDAQEMCSQVSRPIKWDLARRLSGYPMMDFKSSLTEGFEGTEVRHDGVDLESPGANSGDEQECQTRGVGESASVTEMRDADEKESSRLEQIDEAKELRRQLKVWQSVQQKLAEKQRDLVSKFLQAKDRIAATKGRTERYSVSGIVGNEREEDV